MIADNERLSQCAYRIDEDFYQIKHGFSQRFFLFRYNVKQQNNNSNSSEHSLEKSVTNLSN